MKSMGALAVTVLSSLSQAVCAQNGDAVDRLKACSQFEGMERLKCVDELLQEMAPDSAQPQGGGWVGGTFVAAALVTLAASVYAATQGLVFELLLERRWQAVCGGLGGDCVEGLSRRLRQLL